MVLITSKGALMMTGGTGEVDKSFMRDFESLAGAKNFKIVNANGKQKIVGQTFFSTFFTSNKTIKSQHAVVINNRAQTLEILQRMVSDANKNEKNLSHKDIETIKAAVRNVCDNLKLSVTYGPEDSIKIMTPKSDKRTFFEKEPWHL
jgi:hypothetical protein